MSKSEATLYRKIFRDVVQGFTKVFHGEELIFIKHLTTHDQVNLEDIEENFFNKAQARGLKTEQESLDQIIKDELWTREDEQFLSTQKSYVENLYKGKSQLILKSQIDNQERLINTELKKLDEKINEKNELLGETCEKYSKKRANDYYIMTSFYSDEKLTTKLYEEKEFDDVGYSRLSELVNIHNEHFSVFSEDNIQKTILEDFFFPFMSFSEDTMQFFGKPVCELTNHQVKLIIFARIFKSIFDNNENIPEKIRKDPKALIDFASTSNTGKEELDRHEEKGGATTVVGATKEDYEYMGVNPVKAEGGVSLHEKAKKKGGTLNMNDLMEMAGQ